MQTYETIFITIPTLTDQEESDLVEGWAAVVTDGGGSFAANERMGRRRLAYPIRKFEDGVYVRFLYDSASEVPHELERRFGLSDKVLRHLTVKLERDRAVAAKEQAVKDAAARVEAEAARLRQAEERAEAEAKAEAEAEAKAEEEAKARAEAEAAAPEETAPEEPAAESATVDEEAATEELTDTAADDAEPVATAAAGEAEPDTEKGGQ